MVQAVNNQTAVLDMQSAPKQARGRQSEKFRDSFSEAVERQEKPPVQSAADAKPPSKQQEADDGQKVETSDQNQAVELPAVQEETEQTDTILDTIATAILGLAPDLQNLPIQSNDIIDALMQTSPVTADAQDSSLAQIPTLIDLFNAIDQAPDVESQNSFVAQALSEIDKLLGVKRNEQGTANVENEMTVQADVTLGANELTETQVVTGQINTAQGDATGDQNNGTMAGNNSLTAEELAAQTGKSRVEETAEPFMAGQVHTVPTQAAPPIHHDAPADAVTIDVQQGRDVMITKLVDSIQTAITDEKSQMEIQFKPSVLGGLAIKLSMAADGLTAQIVTNNRVTGAMMSSEIAQLTDSLREKGITVQRMEVLDQGMNSATYGNGSGFSQSSYFGAGQQQQSRAYSVPLAENRSAEATYDSMIVAVQEPVPDGLGAVYSA